MLFGRFLSSSEGKEKSMVQRPLDQNHSPTNARHSCRVVSVLNIKLFIKLVYYNSILVL